MSLTRVFSLAVVLCMAGGMVSSCAIFSKKKKKTATESAIVKQQTSYEKLFSGKRCETVRGLLTLHKVDGKVYVELPLRLTGKDILIGSTITKTTNNDFGIVGEKPQEPLAVVFHKMDSVINLCEPVYGHKTDDPYIARRLEDGIYPGIMYRYDIKAYSPDSSAVVIDMTNFFVGNDERISPFSSFSPIAYGNTVEKNFHADRSKVDGVKAFADNVSIRSTLTYTVSVRGPKGEVYINQLPFTVVMTRSIVLLPENPMRPRLADPRIGVFFMGNYSYDANKGVEGVYYTQRWRLEPKDEQAYRAGKLVEPKKPIVFYVDDAFPESWKKPIHDAVENWQTAFEKIGFKNAIIAKDFPKDDPEFDPDNIKYSCIRYSPSWIANAMGPSWVDPRTGEILNASVYVYHNLIKLVRDWRFIQTSQADPEIRSISLSDNILNECIKYVVTHEVGHCLALMHNMSGSAAVPVDSLRSPSFTQKHGTTYSIMDYARNNYVAQPGDKERGVRLTPPDLGAYDLYAIKWLYTPLLDAKTPEEEVSTLDKWITEKSGNPIYRYGKQQFRSRVDPSSFEEDLGDDPIQAATYGVKNLKYILSNLNDWIGKGDKDYEIRMGLYNEILYTYMRYLNHVICNIGGIYLNERYDGDALPTYRTVPKERQKEALEFMLSAMNDINWLNNRDLQDKFPLYGNITSIIQKQTIQALFSKWMWLNICSEKAEKGEAYTSIDYFNDLYDFTWKGTKQGRKLTEFEKLLQVKFMEMGIMNAGLDARSMFGGKLTIAAQNMIAIPECVKERSRHDYGVLPPCVAGIFTNSEDDMLFGDDARFVPAEVSGFAYDDTGFVQTGALTSDAMYAKMKSLLVLLKSRVNGGTPDTRQHYQLLIYQLEKALK